MKHDPEIINSPIDQTLETIRLSLIESNSIDDLASMGIILTPSEFEHYIEYHTMAGYIKRLRAFFRRVFDET